MPTRARPTVNLRHVDGYLQVTVSDEGAGFDPAAMPVAGEGSMGFGLFSIRERLELMGGTFEIQAIRAKGVGLCCLCRLPLLRRLSQFLKKRSCYRKRI